MTPFFTGFQYLASAIVAACGLAADPLSPAAESDPATTQPQAAEISGEITVKEASAPVATSSPEAVEWLKKIEARMAEVKTLQAKLRYDRVQGLVGDKQRRFGTLVYDAVPPAKFAVHFDSVMSEVGEGKYRKDKQDRWYIFDGTWFVERHDDEKRFSKRQIVAPGNPDAPKDQTNPLLEGDGPFAIPVTLKADRVLQRFDVTVAEPDSTDPANAVHLRLIPKPGVKMDATEVDLWYDRDTLLPLRGRNIDDSENESIIDLTNAVVNEPVDPKAIDTDEPEGEGWNVEIKPWEE